MSTVIDVIPGLSRFCRRCVAIDGNPPVTVRIVQGKGKNAIIARDIEIPSVPGELETDLRERLSDLPKTNLVVIECVPKNEDIAVDSIRWDPRPTEDRETGDGNAIDKGVAGILSEVRNMMRDNNQLVKETMDDARETKRNANDLVADVWNERLKVQKLELSRQLDPLQERVMAMGERLGPPIIARMLGLKEAPPAQISGPSSPATTSTPAPQSAVPDEAAKARIRAKCVEVADNAIDVLLATVFESEGLGEEVVMTQARIDRLRPLFDLAVKKNLVKLF